MTSPVSILPAALLTVMLLRSAIVALLASPFFAEQRTFWDAPGGRCLVSSAGPELLSPHYGTRLLLVFAFFKRPHAPQRGVGRERGATETELLTAKQPVRSEWERIAR